MKSQSYVQNAPLEECDRLYLPGACVCAQFIEQDNIREEFPKENM